MGWFNKNNVYLKSILDMKIKPKNSFYIYSKTIFLMNDPGDVIKAQGHRVGNFTDNQ